MATDSIGILLGPAEKSKLICHLPARTAAASSRSNRIQILFTGCRCKFHGISPATHHFPLSQFLSLLQALNYFLSRQRILCLTSVRFSLFCSALLCSGLLFGLAFALLASCCCLCLLPGPAPILVPSLPCCSSFVVERLLISNDE